MPKSRNPENLWKALSDIGNQNPQFASQLQIKLIGKVDLAVKESLRNHTLLDAVTFEDFIPHNQALSLLGGASILLLCINNTPNAKGILTNKFFEYLSAHRPILAIGPEDGDVSVILAETGAGSIFEYNDYERLRYHIIKLFELYSHHKLEVESRNIERFSRKNLTRELCELLNKLIN